MGGEGGEAPTGVVVDTSVFVAAGFKPRSDSGRLVESLRAGRLRLVWDVPTRKETEHVLRKIPPVSWRAVSDLFEEPGRFEGATSPDDFTRVPDEEDRKFAALAAAAGTPLVTLDRPLLAASRAGSPTKGPSFLALRPGELLQSRMPRASD